MSISLPPTSSPYTQILNSFFGYVSEEDKVAFWNHFLVDQGTNASPSDFLEYVQTTYQYLSSLNLSPEEIAKRHILFNIFDIIILLMQTMQDTIGGETSQTDFLTKMQEQYSIAMSRVPLYVSNEAGQMNVSKNSDGSVKDITFGYDQISLTDIGTYITQVMPGKYDPTKAATGMFQVGSPVTTAHVIPAAMATEQLYLQYTPTFTKNASGTYEITGGTIALYATSNSTSGIPPKTNSTTQLVSQVTIPTATAQDADSWKNTAMTLLSPYLEQTTDASGNKQDMLKVTETFPSYSVTIEEPLVILWQFSAVQTSADDTAGQLSAQKRGARNARSQQFIEGIRTKSQSLSDSVSTVQSNINASLNSRKGFMGIMTSSLQQLRNMLDKIFPKT